MLLWDSVFEREWQIWQCVDRGGVPKEWFLTGGDVFCDEYGSLAGSPASSWLLEFIESVSPDQ